MICLGDAMEKTIQAERIINTQHGGARAATIKVVVSVGDSENGKTFAIQDTAGRCRYETKLSDISPMVADGDGLTDYWRNAAISAQKDAKYSVSSTYLQAHCTEYGIDRRAMNALINDYFGFDGKGGYGRE